MALLGDFGFNAPKSKATKKVSTKAVAVAKSKATRQARNTMGSVQKKDVTGNVDAQAIKEAIDSPTVIPGAKTAPAPSHTASAPAAAATQPPAPASPSPTAPKAGTTSQS